MPPKFFLVIFLVSLLAFSPIFFREMPYGFDSFYFLNGVCNQGSLESQPIGAQFVFSLLPCNIMAIKVLFFLCCFASACFAGLLGNIFHERGWLAGIFVFASPIWILEFWKIENDGLAFPILFAAAWLFFSSNSWKRKLAAVFLVGLAFTVWEGSVLWLVAFSLTWLLLAVPVLPALAINFKRFAENIVPNFNATESLPGFGLLYQGFLLTGLMFILALPAIIAPTSFFILIALINAKYAIHATFLLSIHATTQFLKARTSVMKYMPLMGAAIVILFTVSMSFSLPPDSQELSVAELAVAEARGETICNDWGTGHLLEFLGGKPLAKGGGEQLCYGCEDCLVLSYREFDCPLINKVERDTDIRLYRC